MKDIKKILLSITLIAGMAFVLYINATSFFSENGYVLAEEMGEGEPETKKEEKKAKPPKAAKKTLKFQQVAAKIFDQKVGLDDSGDVYYMGLTAKYTGPEDLLPGEGKYGKLFKYLPVMRWYDPEHYYTSTQVVEGEFKSEQCILCHMIKTPGIVAQWKKSKHATSWKQTVGCDACHGSNHQKLYMPTHKECGKCHPKQTAGHMAGGKGSHSQAFHISTNEASWQIGKPAEEVTACATCHGKAENTCDGCHTRHGFSKAEARKPAGCAVCHRGLGHYEYEMWMQSYHGLLWASNGYSWDWTKPMKPQNYQTPTCAYCHMQGGEHNQQAFSTVHTGMGVHLVDRGAPKYKATRDAWIKTCSGCHSPRFARDQLEAADEAIKVAFTKWREAMKIIVDLYNDGILDPMPEDLAPDWSGHYTFSLFPGGEGRMFNVSFIEKKAFEMLVYITNAIYKAMAHSGWYGATYGKGAFLQDRWLIDIKGEASKLRRISTLEKKVGIDHKAYDFWKHGEYTDLLLGWKRKEGDIKE
jgi:hydroxylamine dehydrogenase